MTHETLYLGEYLSGGERAKTASLQHNYHAALQQWVEPDHRDVAYLLYVTNPASPEIERARLEAECGIRRRRHAAMRPEAGRHR